MDLYLLCNKNGEIFDNEHVYPEDSLTTAEESLKLYIERFKEEKINTINSLLYGIDSVMEYFKSVDKCVKRGTLKSIDEISNLMIGFLSELSVSVQIGPESLLFSINNKPCLYNINRIEAILYKNIAEMYKNACRKENYEFNELFRWVKIKFGTDDECFPSSMRNKYTIFKG